MDEIKYKLFLDSQHNYLYQDSTNKSHLKLLCDLIFNKRNKFIPFIGTGLSKPTGIPLLNKILKNMCKDYNKNYLYNKKYRNRKNYPRLFSDLYQNLNKNEQDSFFDLLFKNIKTTKTPWHATHFHLINYFDFFVTTNYDDIIEKAYLDINMRYLNRHYLGIIDYNKLKECVMYLHGHIDKGYAIIRDEDYNNFYPSLKNNFFNDTQVEPFLEFIYEIYHLVFLGFSFNDNYLYRFFNNLSNEYPQQKHFWIIDKDTFYPEKKIITEKNISNTIIGMEESFKKYIKMNIYPIVYNNHDFIANLFSFINKSTPDSKPPVYEEKNST